MARLYAALAIASLLAAGCGSSSSPASPSGGSFAGAWDAKVLAAPHGVLGARGHSRWPGHRRSPHGSSVAMAERVRGAADRFHPTRVPRSRDRHERSGTVADTDALPDVLPPVAHASRAGQGCATAAADRATRSRPGHSHSAGRRPPPSVRPPRGIATAGLRRKVSWVSGSVRTVSASRRECRMKLIERSGPLSNAT
jgi:hypothetical protein